MKKNNYSASELAKASAELAEASQEAADIAMSRVGNINMTITPFSLLLQLSCMSRGEAAQYLDVRFDTVQKWVSGRDPCPPGAIFEIKKLIADQEWCAKNTRLEAGKSLAGPIFAELGNEGNWPNLGAWRGYAARVIADSFHGAEIVIKPASEK